MRNRINLSPVTFLLAALLLGLVACSKTQDQRPAQKAQSQEDKDLLAWGKGDRWMRSENIDKMDGHKTVLLSAWATDLQDVDQAHPQTLNISCGSDVSVYLITGPAEDGVRIKFDNAAPTREKWSAFGRFVGPLFSGGKIFLRRLVKAQTVTIEFSPLGKGPVVETFKVTNLPQLLQADQQYCKL